MPLHKIAQNIDADEIIPGLWQGSKPPIGLKLKQLGFDVLVLCAEEWQKAELYKDIEVILAPNDDDPRRMPTQGELNIAISAAKKVAQNVRQGRKVLVTCWQGWNRSGLVSALAVHIVTGMDGFSCIARVQGARENALCNGSFCKVLGKLKPKASSSTV